jgi:hypothetical protein
MLLIRERRQTVVREVREDFIKQSPWKNREVTWMAYLLPCYEAGRQFLRH